MPLQGRREMVFALLLSMLSAGRADPQMPVPSTTVYVGRHFEVRGHDQPTKYIFNGSTRVAEITGSLSSNARVQRIRLFPGWNLLSVAVSVDDFVGQLAHDQQGIIESIYLWNAGSGGYTVLSPGQAVAAGSVLWIQAATNALLGITGSYSDPTKLHVEAGGGYLAGPGLEAWIPALPVGFSEWVFDSEFDQWIEELGSILGPGPVAPISLGPGMPIYVRASAPADLQMPDPTLRIRYYHQDHLGSSSVITDAGGGLVEEAAFHPFGTPRHISEARLGQEPYQFTQKERDGESGLHYFEARYMAGMLARFVTPDIKYANPDALPPDSLVSLLLVPQQLNLYSYVRNNPLNLVDPTGLDGKSPSPNAARPEVIVIYGHDMFEDIHRRTGVDRPTYEKALKGTYEAERKAAGQNAKIIVKYVGTKKELRATFKNSTYAAAIVDSHAYLNQKGLILSATDENHVEDVSPEELQDILAGAKQAPKKLYFYGCNTSKTGFAKDVSQRMGSDTEVTGSANEISQGFKGSQAGGNFSLEENRDYNVTYSGGEEKSDARKVDASNFSLPR